MSAFKKILIFVLTDAYTDTVCIDIDTQNAMHTHCMSAVNTQKTIIQSTSKYSYDLSSK